MMARWTRGVRQRWRVVLSVVATLLGLLLTFTVFWTPINIVDPTNAAGLGVDVKEVRRILLNGVADERGTWPCINASDCLLTPGLLGKRCIHHHHVAVEVEVGHCWHLD